MDEAQHLEATAEQTHSKPDRLKWSQLLFGLALLAITGAAGGAMWREFADLGLLARSWRLAPEPDRFIHSLRDDYPLLLDLRRRLATGAHLAVVGVETRSQHRTVVSLRSLLHRRKVASVTVADLPGLRGALEPEDPGLFVLVFEPGLESSMAPEWRLLQRYRAPSRDAIYSLWQSERYLKPSAAPAPDSSSLAVRE